MWTPLLRSASRQQAAAVDLLTAGRTLTDAAAAVGVDRATVSGWVNHHPAFIAALHSRRQELWDGLVDELRGLLPKALAVLKQELDGPSPYRPRSRSSRAVGWLRAPYGPRDPRPWTGRNRPTPRREIERVASALTAEDVELAQQRRESDRRFAALTALAV